MSSQRIWLQQPVTADLKLFPDVKWLMSVVGHSSRLSGASSMSGLPLAANIRTSADFSWVQANPFT